MGQYPRSLNLAGTFTSLVNWFYDELIVNRKAPGFLVGLSGTDSLVVFCAAALALEKAGKGDRMMGVHFAPSEDFLYDHPEAEVHLWFKDQVLPWLTKKYPNAKVVVDTSIDWRCDGLRWGALMDMSVVSNDRRRTMRLPEDQYWVVGTRNKTEDQLLNYSNASTAVSVQPIIHLWKSEILQLSEYLGVPKIAIAKSCETDCICGREQLAAQYVNQIDWILMHNEGILADSYLDQISTNLRLVLSKYIISQMEKGKFKLSLPYSPQKSMIVCVDPLILSFEDGSLNLSEFNHYKHLQIAWYYLKNLPFNESVDKFSNCLQSILNAAGRKRQFNLEITQSYFERLDKVMTENPTDSFEELVEKVPSILLKSSA